MAGRPARAAVAEGRCSVKQEYIIDAKIRRLAVMLHRINRDRPQGMSDSAIEEFHTKLFADAAHQVFGKYPPDSRIIASQQALDELRRRGFQNLSEVVRVVPDRCKRRSEPPKGAASC